MWKCQVCNEEIEDQFDSCWKCAEKLVPVEETPPNPLNYLRCQGTMKYLGNKSFREWGFLADFGIDREHFDLYLCPRCGHVDFFVDGIGAESRPR
jgi:hypothetical protein